MHISIITELRITAQYRNVYIFTCTGILKYVDCFVFYSKFQRLTSTREKVIFSDVQKISFVHMIIGKDTIKQQEIQKRVLVDNNILEVRIQSAQQS